MRIPALALVAALAACAGPRSATAGPPEPARSGSWSLELVDERGGVLPTFEHRGRTYVLGTAGQRYQVRVRSASPRRAEVVVSVDGRDVIDGRPAAWEKRGYLVEPYGEVVIDGFRLSDASVAAFRFGSVARSYAARMGDARDVGVIGVAVFPEREPAWYPPPPYPYPYPPPPWPEELRDRSEAAPRSSGDGPAASEAAPRSSGDAAASAAPGAKRRGGERPGLGTEFGEEHGSPVRQERFVRASPRPEAVLTLRYDDRRGLLAAGVDVDRRDEAWRRETARPFRRDPAYAEPPPGWR